MRKIKLSPEEANILFTTLNLPKDPRVGLTMPEIRQVTPLLDQIEEKIDRVPFVQDGQAAEKITFHEVDFCLKETEFVMVKERLENSYGWESVTMGKRVNAFLERFSEAQFIEDNESSKDQKKEKGGKK